MTDKPETAGEKYARALLASQGSLRVHTHGSVEQNSSPQRNLTEEELKRVVSPPLQQEQTGET
jgi:hypothetical protein